MTDLKEPTMKDAFGNAFVLQSCSWATFHRNERGDTPSVGYSPVYVDAANTDRRHTPRSGITEKYVQNLVQEKQPWYCFSGTASKKGKKAIFLDLCLHLILRKDKFSSTTHGITSWFCACAIKWSGQSVCPRHCDSASSFTIQYTLGDVSNQSRRSWQKLAKTGKTRFGKRRKEEHWLYS